MLRNLRCFRTAPIGRRTLNPLWDDPYKTCAIGRGKKYVVFAFGREAEAV